MFFNICGYAFGASTWALFGMIAGGIFNKAADIGADLMKKDSRMKKDCSLNPGVVADQVGDIAG